MKFAVCLVAWLICYGEGNIMCNEGTNTTSADDLVIIEDCFDTVCYKPTVMTTGVNGFMDYGCGACPGDQDATACETCDGDPEFPCNTWTNPSVEYKCWTVNSGDYEEKTCYNNVEKCWWKVNDDVTETGGCEADDDKPVNATSCDGALCNSAPTCPVPAVLNGTTVPSTGVYSSKYTVTCDTGFHLVDDVAESGACQLDGTFYAPTPLCTERKMLEISSSAVYDYFGENVNYGRPTYSYDGDTMTFYVADSGDPNWLKLYLSQYSHINSVTVINRMTPSYFSRLQNTAIYVYSRNAEVKHCGTITEISDMLTVTEQTYEVECGGVEGDMIYLTDLDKTIHQLNIAEVKVYGEPIGFVDIHVDGILDGVIDVAEGVENVKIDLIDGAGDAIAGAAHTVVDVTGDTPVGDLAHAVIDGADYVVDGAADVAHGAVKVVGEAAHGVVDVAEVVVDGAADVVFGDNDRGTWQERQGGNKGQWAGQGKKGKNGKKGKKGKKSKDGLTWRQRQGIVD